MAKKSIALALLFFPLFLSAQSIRDTVQSVHMFSFHVSGHVPAGDIATRYGLNAGVGGSYMYKTASNWLFAGEYTFLFGDTYKEFYRLDGLRDSEGYFITVNGEQMFPTITERGFYAGLKLGKIFPVIGPNPNSGLMLSASAGLLQYKTFFRLEETSVPVLLDDYVKMLDYLTNGFAMNQFIGYLHFDNERPFNFYVGFDFHQGWTRGRRDWLYDIQGPDHSLRHDFLFGIRAGWIFRAGRKTTGSYTYF